MLLDHLRAAQVGGRKLVIPYVVGGIPDPASFPAALAAVAACADAVEVGLPYSDPLMDGPVIASAARRAIAAGVGPLDVLAMAAIDGPPRLAMTYYNPIHHAGEKEFCARAADAGFAGLIVPDLPLEESGSLRAAAAERNLAWVPLVAPTSPAGRVEAIAGTATGFVYAVSTLGVTGARAALSERAASVVAACRASTDLPVVVGIGISTAGQAVEACSFADGVVVGSAVVRILLEDGIEAAGRWVAGVREALDTAAG
ncbi:MAG: tryptophan synthase subunit alpha [Actinomycetota bacterium]